MQPSGLFRKLAKTAVNSVLQAAFPPGCLNCSEPLETPGHLCGNCWTEMTFISAPYCEICGYPFDFQQPDSLICGNCIRRQPGFSRARAVLKYDEASRDMVLSYKHSDQTRNAPAFANWMYRAAADLVRDCDILCAVPLHPLRLIRRRYNQSALLVMELSRISGKVAVPDLLIRKRPTRSQSGLNATARRRNVQGVFGINRKHLSLVENTRILLIDDVLTTGATVDACSRTLLNAGASQIDVLTLCRVVRASSLVI